MYQLMYCVVPIWHGNISNKSSLYIYIYIHIYIYPQLAHENEVQGVGPCFKGFARDSFHFADGRLIARPHEVSKPQDSDFSNLSAEMPEWYDHCNIRSCGFDTSRDLTVRRLTAYWIQALDSNMSTCSMLWIFHVHKKHGGTPDIKLFSINADSSLVTQQTLYEIIKIGLKCNDVWHPSN